MEELVHQKKVEINKKGFLNEKGENEKDPDKNNGESCTESGENDGLTSKMDDFVKKILKALDYIISDLLFHKFKMLMDQGDDYSKQNEDIFSQKNNLKYELENTLNIPLSEECYKEKEEIAKILEMTILEYLEKMESEYSFLQIENKNIRNNKIGRGKRIIKKLYGIFKAFQNEENQKKLKQNENEESKKKLKQKNNEVKNNKLEKNDIKDDPYKLFMLMSMNQPTYKNKLPDIVNNDRDFFNWNQINTNINRDFNTKRKKIRKDNLLLILKKTVMSNFIDDFNEKNNTESNEKDKEPNFYKIDKKEIEKFIKQEKNNVFFNSDFSGIVGRYKEDEEKKKTMKESEEAKMLIKINKSDYLLNKIKEQKEKEGQEKQEYSIFQNYIDKKRKEIQNNKCKKVIFEFFKKKNLKGLILLLNCIKPEKQYYLKINNANVFKEAIISKYGPNSFTIDLNEEENEEIEDIKEQLNQLTKNVKCLSKKK